MAKINYEDEFILKGHNGIHSLGYRDTLKELLEDLEEFLEFDEEKKKEVENWALNASKGDVFEKYGAIITSIGKVAQW